MFPDKTIFYRHTLTRERCRCWFEIPAARSQSHRAGYACRTNRDAIDTAFDIQKLIVDGIVFTAVIAAAPNARTIESKIDTLLEGRTTFALFIHNFNIHRRW